MKLAKISLDVTKPHKISHVWSELVLKDKHAVELKLKKGAPSLPKVLNSPSIEHSTPCRVIIISVWIYVVKYI